MHAQHRAYCRAYEAVARFAERAAGSIQFPDGIAIASNPAAQFMKSHEIYVRKARRYQMRQKAVQEWTEKDVSRTLSWKAVNEAHDHLRKIRRELAKPSRVVKMPPRHPDEIHKYWIETVISYLEAQKTKAAQDGAILVEFLWRNTNALTATPKRRMSFKAQLIADQLSRGPHDIWDVNRVQRARALIIEQMSQFENKSITDVIDTIRSKIKKNGA